MAIILNFFFKFLAHNQSDMVDIYYRNLKPKGFNINLGISKLSHTDIVNTVIISPNLLKHWFFNLNLNWNIKGWYPNIIKSVQSIKINIDMVLVKFNMSHVSVWHPEKLILTLQRARTSLSLPQIIFVNGKHILIDGNTQKETRTSNKKSTFFMSHTDALYHSEENPP